MKSILTAILVTLSTVAFSQIIQDPTSWSYEFKKKDAKHYTLMFHATIKSPWHVYAMAPGGDGTLIGTSFKFNNVTAITRSGNIKAITKPQSLTMEGVDGKVNLYTGKADFVQEVTGTPGATITGTIEYQACNDKMCLPPKKKTFSFTLR